MATVYNNPGGENKKTPQSIQNTSFDNDFGVSAVEPLTFNPLSNSLERTVHFGQGNASYVFTYDGSSNLTDIDKTVGTTTYHKDLTYDGSSNLTDISVWTQT